MKTCSACKEVLNPSLFSKSSTNRDGLQNYCKPCAKEKRAARYAAKVVEERAQNRQWFQENKPWLRPDKREYLNSWRRGKDRRTESQNRRGRLADAGSFTTDEWKGLCEKYGNGCLSCGGLDITVDHVVALSKGERNTVDNLQPLCQSCNSKKGTKTIDYRR